MGKMSDCSCYSIIINLWKNTFSKISLEASDLVIFSLSTNFIPTVESFEQNSLPCGEFRS